MVSFMTKEHVKVRDRRLLVASVALSLITAVGLFASTALVVPSWAHAACMVVLGIAGFAALCFGSSSLSGSSGRPSASWCGRILARCILIVAGFSLSIILYGCLAFLLDLFLFPLMGTQAALAVLEAVAVFGSTVLAPLAVMLLTGCVLNRDAGLHPLAEIRCVRGA